MRSIAVLDDTAGARGEGSTALITGSASEATGERSCLLSVARQHAASSWPAQSQAVSFSPSSQFVSSTSHHNHSPVSNDKLDLAIALTNKDIGQEIHILFILLLLSITIFFCHALIRLCMLILNPPREDDAAHRSVPNLTAAEGFQPVVPIPVRLARDEALDSDDEEVGPRDPEKEVLPPPPPAYGLWRSSVRVDPNLLHWQRVEDNRAASAISMPHSRSSRTASEAAPAPVGVASPPLANANASALASLTAPADAPRPPSYVSEDGVSYITEAAPRSVAPPAALPAAQDARTPPPPPSGVHPAWRTSYVMSEIRPGEVPSSMGRR